MRWLYFMLLCVVLLTLQSAGARLFELFGGRPDWLLVVVVFFAMRAPPRDAIIGAWIIGGFADLMTIERLGLLALTYGLAAVAVVSAREFIFRERALTQFLVTLVAGLSIRCAWLVYSRALYDPAAGLLMDLAVGVLFVSLYTAAWAPLCHKGLLGMSRFWGLKRSRYTYAR